MKAAQAAGLQKSDSLHSVRIEGSDKPGLGAKLTHALAEAGLNLRGLSGASFVKRFVCYLALDTGEPGRECSKKALLRLIGRRFGPAV